MQTSSSEVEIYVNDDESLELFCNAMRDAVIARTSTEERFSAIRLSSTTMNYAGALDHLWGSHSGTGVVKINPMQSKRALDLAETVIHEMAHALVGNAQRHNENWHDAARFLGLVAPDVQKAKPTQWADFDANTQAVIRDAIERFCKDNPKLVVQPDADILWPSHIGTYECENEHEAWHACRVDGVIKHRAHILKYQIDGIRDGLKKIAGGSGWLLADSMGLGKTVQAQGLLNTLLKDVEHPKILVLCPNNAKLIWKHHFREFSTLDVKFDGDNANAEVAYSNMYMYSDIVIMNYEALVKWNGAVASQEWDVVIDDEAHYLKTPSAQRSKAAFAINAKAKILVTGSPIVNYFYEIFPLAHYLNRKVFPEYGRFERLFGSKSSDKFGRNLGMLNQMLRGSIMTRRDKKEVEIQFPKKRRSVVEIEVTDEIKKLIDEENKLWATMSGDNDTEAVMAINALKNESEVAEDDIDWAAIIDTLMHTKKYAFTEMARIAHKIGIAKVPFAIDFIEDLLESKEKVLIFCHHRDVAKAYGEHWKGNSITLMGGNTDQALATKQFEERFNNDDSITVGIAQITNAQSYSIKSTSTVIFVEEDWVPGVMLQAEDRCHGIGRGEEGSKSMSVTHLTFENSLDTYKAKLTIRKLKSIDRAVGGKK